MGLLTGLDWTLLVQVMDQWVVIINTVITLKVT
jgi:hypothetical protein